MKKNLQKKYQYVQEMIDEIKENLKNYDTGAEVIFENLKKEFEEANINININININDFELALSKYDFNKALESLLLIEKHLEGGEYE